MSRPILRLYVSNDLPELVELYTEKIAKHNQAVLNDPHPNAGFDLYCVDGDWISMGFQTSFINFRVKGQMTRNGDTEAYYLYPRSSISKTPLMMANNTGIIDSGYLGFLIGAFRNISTVSDYVTHKHDRLVQICSRDLSPFTIELVVDEADLGVTSRMTGGFGSTGR
jgi:dUTP pyrophosphatase